MNISKEFSDSLLQGVLDRVTSSLTPADDTPDDDNGILGLVKNALSPDQDKNEGIMGILSGALSGDSDQASGSGGLLDMLSGMLGGGKQTQAPQEKSGGIMDMISDVISGGSQEEKEPQKNSSLLGMITGAIGGEGVLGDLLEKILKGKGLNVRNFTDVNGDGIPDDIKDVVIDRIKDFVVDKVKDKLSGSQASQSGLLSRFTDIISPDN